jgi:hypothetical protein
MVQKFYYGPIQEVVDFFANKYRNKNVLEIGPGDVPFPSATHTIGYSEKVNYTEIDIDTQKIPFGDHFFDFTYCRHVLEDIQNPDFAMSEMFRVSKCGYIETPSPLVEVTKGVDNFGDAKYRGYIHHRYIVWSHNNTVYFLPKYPIIEYSIPEDEPMSHLLKFPGYWNNYIVWNADTKVVVYKNGVNMKINKDYAKLINRAVEESIQSTDEFMKRYKK